MNNTVMTPVKVLLFKGVSSVFADLKKEYFTSPISVSYSQPISILTDTKQDQKSELPYMTPGLAVGKLRPWAKFCHASPDPGLYTYQRHNTELGMGQYEILIVW